MMETQQVAVLAIVNLVIAETLAGLVMRGRAGHCWSFVAYLCGVLTCDTLLLADPDRYYTPEFWGAKQALFDVLRTAVALEMTWRVVRAFPGALRTARRFALVLLVGGSFALMGAPRQAGLHDLVAWQPRVVACTALLFTLTALLVAWYHLPMRRLHRVVMGGFAVYSAFFASVLSVMVRSGFDHRVWLNFVDAVAYLGVCVVWMRAAWTSVEEPMPVLVIDTPAAAVPLLPREAGRAA